MELPNINKKKIKALLREEKRLDNRDPFEYREIFIETGISDKAEGSSRVRIGKTEVVVGVKLDTQEPYTDHLDEGTMVVGMEFNPICGSRYESGAPKMNAIEVSRVVDRGIRESGFIDWKKLCIKKGEKVWSIMIDIYCINDDGNVLDASSLGAVIALKLAKFPVYDKKEEVVRYGEFTDDYLPLSENFPLTITFYKAGDNMLTDPNRDEEDASEARITLAISSVKKEKIIHSMQKGGISPVSLEELDEIIRQAERVYDKLFSEIDKRIKKL